MRLRRSTQLPAPPLGAGWREAEFCVLDVETTGMDLRRDDVVSYGAVIVANGRIHCGRSAYRLVRPERAVSVAALAVHQLRQVDLAGAPRIDDVLNDLTDLLANRALVAHAAWFEEAFLNRALRRRGRVLNRAVIDTAALLRACGLAAVGTPRESAVEAAARKLKVPVHTPHHALGDAVTAAEVFLVLATRLERRLSTTDGRPLSVRQLCELSRRYGTSGA
jgi:DNA polymerase-3 subunit epsilon